MQDAPTRQRETDLLARLDAGDFEPFALYELNALAQRLSIVPGFDRLLAPDACRAIVPFEHQIAAARTALARHRGRVLLCVEVGLGKTIEAGLVALELALRGLARRILILVPPVLLDQWASELREKFGLDFAVAGPGFDWRTGSRTIASLATAKRAPHADAIAAQGYDLVIVDEAHHLRNRNTLAWKFVQSLSSRYLLLLTATPVQNNLVELYNLVTLLRPGQLHTLRGFQKEHISKSDPLLPRDPERLRRLVSEVMIRNRRSAVDVRFTRRVATTYVIEPAPEERRLYADVTAAVRSSFGQGATRMLLMTLQSEIGSSPAASVDTLARGGWADLSARASVLPSTAKERRLLDLLHGHDEKTIVFTRFRGTHQRLLAALADGGIETASLAGGMTLDQREAAVARFRGEARVLVSTEVGSEGRNLQFCRRVVNYDIPWNPMRIEQRIGRVSRIGQTEEVLVDNLAVRDTIEAHLLDILDAKINMFELVVGEIDMIIGTLDDDREFDDQVFDAWGGAPTDEEARTRMDELGRRLVEGRTRYRKIRDVEDRLLGDVS